MLPVAYDHGVGTGGDARNGETHTVLVRAVRAAMGVRGTATWSRGPGHLRRVDRHVVGAVTAEARTEGRDRGSYRARGWGWGPGQEVLLGAASKERCRCRGGVRDRLQLYLVPHQLGEVLDDRV